MEDTIGYEDLFSAEEWDRLNQPEPDQHQVTVWYPPGEFEGNDERHELECDVCGYIGAEDSFFEAEKVAVLHEILGARVVESRSVQR